jgi:hypothetical protein
MGGGQLAYMVLTPLPTMHSCMWAGKPLHESVVPSMGNRRTGKKGHALARLPIHLVCSPYLEGQGP